MCSRGRNAGYPAPPAQIPSMRNYRTGLLPQVRRRNVDSLLLVPCSVRSTLLPAPVCRSRPSEHSSPRPEAFSPRTPPVVGHTLGVIVHLCSFASSILCLRPTSQARTCRAFVLWPSPTGPAVDDSRSPLGSPLRGRFQPVGLTGRRVGYTSRRPLSVQGVCVNAPVLGLRGSGAPLALARCTVLPSPPRHKVGNPN